MNRLVLIGNGFDLAHGLKTSYADFINWYWDERVKQLSSEATNTSSDPMCTIAAPDGFRWSAIVANRDEFNYQLSSSNDIIKRLENNDLAFKITYTSFLDNIRKSIENRKWVDIEIEYYELLKKYAFPSDNSSSTESSIRSLNRQLDFLKKLLCQYLQEVCKQNPQPITSIQDAIYSPIRTIDIPYAGSERMKEHVEYWRKQGLAQLQMRKQLFGITNDIDVSTIINKPLTETYNGDYPLLLRLPTKIMLLNFNYTNTPCLYFKEGITLIDYIHGTLERPESIIFGYEDEMDDKFKELKNHKNNDCLKNIKSLRYLLAPDYSNLSSFMDSEPFQVFIMGHSCGNSDRTLLNMIFEHKNCVSIKQYYHQKSENTDDFNDKVLNINRTFNDKKHMLDKVVNKTQCEPLGHS